VLVQRAGEERKNLLSTTILGSGGRAPSAARETACSLVREGNRALLLDAGTGLRRLIADPAHLDGVGRLDVVLTHFHFDHVCGLPFLPLLEVEARIWAPGRWLYGTPSASILEPLRRPPVAPDDVTAVYPVEELGAGEQSVGGFVVRASAQPRHWAPSAGLRVDDELALITDTAYEPTSAVLAAGVPHLLHEAWSTSSAPRYPDKDSTAADAGRVAREAGVGQLTLIHIDPQLADPSALLDDAAEVFDRVGLGSDHTVLES
jgi:ribonuclease BN (tRNA processing enzyme)